MVSPLPGLRNETTHADPWLPPWATNRSPLTGLMTPRDSNPLDNRFYFVFSEPPVRTAVIVSDDARTGEAFRLGLAIPTESGLQHHADVISSARVGEIDWESTALLIWQAPLPTGLVAKQIEQFVDSGRVVMFFRNQSVHASSLTS